MWFCTEAVCYCSENSSKKKKTEDNFILFLTLYSSWVVVSREFLQNALKQLGKVKNFELFQNSSTKLCIFFQCTRNFSGFILKFFGSVSCKYFNFSLPSILNSNYILS